jgi:hypothetical protein
MEEAQLLLRGYLGVYKNLKAEHISLEVQDQINLRLIEYQQNLQ